jgi:hypothetical protein
MGSPAARQATIAQGESLPRIPGAVPWSLAMASPFRNRKEALAVAAIEGAICVERNATLVVHAGQTSRRT